MPRNRNLIPQKAFFMTRPPTFLLEIKGDKVIGVSGEASEEIRSLFAREAEGLQARAHQIGLAIGMSALACSSVAHSAGSIGFRFAKSSDEGFDAKGILVTGTGYSGHSLYEATK